jgi:hypothetical protein
MASRMRYSAKIRLRRKLAIVFSSIAALAADKAPPFKPKAAADYASKSSLDQVTIAVEPFDTEEKTFAAFGKIHPPRYGVLPVLVVIQNGRSTPLDGRRLKFHYKVRGEPEIESTPSAEIRFAAGGPAPPKVNQPTGLPFPLPTRSKKNPLADPIINERAFAAKMIAPGESASGFVYFQTEYHGGATITLSGLRDPSTGQDLFFVEIPIVHR